jgi:tellurite resistance protein TehA-like permease
VNQRRRWAGAFNVVMATGIVSIACRDARIGSISLALEWLAVTTLVFVSALELAYPHRSRPAQEGFAFVAAVSVVGTRLDVRVPGTALLVIGALVWLALWVAAAGSWRRVRAARTTASWLLAVVATEGLAILAGNLARTGAVHDAAVAVWAFGGVVYLAICWRLSRMRLNPEGLTPDWWIVMGAPAIFTLAAATLDRDSLSSALGVLALAAWALATALLPFLVAGEMWRIRRLGRPRFFPARWTMVFPLGMYSTCGQRAGYVLGIGWIHDVGHWWVIVALVAWTAVAAGELRELARQRG